MWLYPLCGWMFTLENTNKKSDHLVIMFYLSTRILKADDRGKNKVTIVVMQLVKQCEYVEKSENVNYLMLRMNLIGIEIVSLEIMWNLVRLKGKAKSIQ